ncbi:MAG TPA: sodium:proton antiporter, partial [Chloroflexota bacterium]|nr:sodium:proton antiporter [Chloroflexota bacterium]
SLLLIAGMVGAQLLPGFIGEAYTEVSHGLRLATMVALAFIMIHVGYEFELDKTNLRQYGWDYVVAMTAAAFPWVFVVLYFIFVLLPAGAWGSWPAWVEALLAGRFAAPTSAGILFAMLAAAGLSATWLFAKARILAIFDDLDTVLLMIPLQMLIVGLAWQLGVVVMLMGVLLWVGWRYLHGCPLPVTWPWVLSYAVGITALSELLYTGSYLLDDTVPVHIEVLLPAFVVGCVLARPLGSDPHRDDAVEGSQMGPETPGEQRVATLIAAVFMGLVGLSLPPFAAETAATASAESISAAQPPLPWGVMAGHVLALTVLANLGKMVPALCYRREVHWRERLALAIGMWPRGEVGAGVLIVSLGYGLGGPMITAAMLSLALNLVLTGVFILLVQWLVAGDRILARADLVSSVHPRELGR